MAVLDVVSIASVRDYLQVTDTTREWSNGIIGSNIMLASKRLQRVTNRQWEPTSETKLFTTNGREFVPIPDVRSFTSVTLNDSTMTENETYYPIPSRHESTIYIGLQFPRLKNRSSIFAVSDWFDRGLDLPDYQRDVRRGLPNDLAVASTEWGRDEAAWPIEVVQAIRAYAAFLGLRTAALLSGARQSPEGNVFDLSRLPLEVQDFVRNWSNHDAVVTVS